MRPSLPVSRDPFPSPPGSEGDRDSWVEPPRNRVAAPQLRHLRGSVIESSLAELRVRGLFAAYQRVLEPSAEYLLYGSLADRWLPLGACMSHYAACDEVVPSAVALEIGAASGRRLQESIISTVLKLATGAGVTPWTVFSYYQRMWTRVFDGGGVSISKVGPKDAIVAVDDFPLARFTYFRTAFRGTHEGLLRLFVKQVFVHEVAKHSTATTFRYSIAWA